MKWAQIGTAKSGNYWIYNILQRVAEKAGLERKSFIQNQPIHAIAKNWKLAFPNQQDIDHISILPHVCNYNIAHIFNMPIDDIDEYIRQTSHVWIHSPYCSRSNEVLRKFEKLIYIVRDPRDIAMSLSRYAFTPWRQTRVPHGEKSPETYLKNRLDDITFNWVNHVGDYLKHGKKLNIYFVFYERFLFDFNTELKKMLQYLDVSLNDKAIEEINQQVSFETMKKRSKDHLNKGECGQWIDGLTDGQVKQVCQLAGPLLKFLGYALTKKEQRANPALPQIQNYSPQSVEQILTHTRRMRRVVQAKKLLGKIKTKVRAKGIPI